MSWHPRQPGQQTGRTFVVTGANSGLGLEAARELVGRGAHVVFAGLTLLDTLVAPRSPSAGLRAGLRGRY